MSNSSKSAWYTRATFAVLFIALAVVVLTQQSEKNASIDRVNNERNRAVLGECRAANEAIGEIRVAILVTAGYQSAALPGASPELQAQIIAGNARRAALAKAATEKIIDIRCPGDPPVTSTTTTTTGGFP